MTINIIKGRIANPNEFDTDQAYAIDLDIFNGFVNEGALPPLQATRVLTLYAVTDNDLFELLEMIRAEYKDNAVMRSTEVTYSGWAKTYIVYEIEIKLGNVKLEPVNEAEPPLTVPETLETKPEKGLFDL